MDLSNSYQWTGTCAHACMHAGCLSERAGRHRNTHSLLGIVGQRKRTNTMYSLVPLGQPLLPSFLPSFLPSPSLSLHAHATGRRPNWTFSTSSRVSPPSGLYIDRVASTSPIRRASTLIGQRQSVASTRTALSHAHGHEHAYAHAHARDTSACKTLTRRIRRRRAHATSVHASKHSRKHGHIVTNRFEVDLRAGEALYLPSGWMHDIQSSGIYQSITYWLYADCLLYTSPSPRDRG